MLACSHVKRNYACKLVYFLPYSNSMVRKKTITLAQMVRMGGKARQASMTPEERTKAARKAAEARWAKTRALVSEITEGTKKLEKVAQAKARRKAKSLATPK